MMGKLERVNWKVQICMYMEIKHPSEQGSEEGLVAPVARTREVAYCALQYLSQNGKRNT